MSDEYFEGKGCTCAAYNEGECCCGVDWTDPEIYKLRKQIASQQATIDSLMLEYCPKDMTKEQISNWEIHQVQVKSGDL